MPEIIHCPGCSREVRVPESLKGQVVKCPMCLVQFRADESRAILSDQHRTEPPPFEESVEPDSKTAVPAPESPCPFCQESVPVDADRCPYCGESLSPLIGPSQRRSFRPRLRRDSEPHRGDTIFLFGLISLISACLSLLCCVGIFPAVPFGLAAILMANHDLSRMEAGLMDPHGESQTRSGRTLGIIGVVIGIVVLLLWIAFVLLSILAEAAGR